MRHETTATHDHGLFRRVMGSFATGVTVVTTDVHGEARGMTANAFMSASIEPPLCVISVGKRARMHPLLIEAGHFGISILAKDQERLSTHFAGGRTADSPPQFIWIGRTPVLANVSAILTADIAVQHDCGDHTLFVGRILHLDAFGRPPLVFHDARYASITHTTEIAPEWVADFW